MLEKSKDEIISDLSRMYTQYKKQISKKKDIKYKALAISLLIIDKNGNKKHLYDVDLFRRAVIELIKKSYYIKYSNTISKKENQICSLCNKLADEVYGFVTEVFKFYNLDKPGFAPDFRQEYGWKLYPVCFECAKYLETGRRYLDKHLNMRFYGNFTYYLIPKFLFGIDEYTIDIIENWKSPTFSEKHDADKMSLRRLFSEEDEIIQYLSELENYVSFNFLFYREEQQALRILLNVTDVLPSRLHALYSVKEELDKEPIFAVENLRFNFMILRNIFPQSKTFGDYDKYYLNIVGKIIMGKTISYKFLIKSIMDRVRDGFIDNKVASFADKNYRQFHRAVLGYYMFLRYVSGLKILDTIKEVEHVGNDENPFEKDRIVDQAEVFFNSNSEFFDSPAKKGIFLLGLLTQKLLDIQYRERNATPFMSKLNGLKLNQRLIIRLLPMVENKLEEYKKNHIFRDVEDKISEYFVQAGKNWNLNNDEISFYFVIGMNLAKRFRNKKAGEGEEEGEN